MVPCETPSGSFLKTTRASAATLDVLKRLGVPPPPRVLGVRPRVAAAPPPPAGT